MLFLERHNESGTIFTYTNCSDGGMGRPGKPVGLPKICFKVRYFSKSEQRLQFVSKSFHAACMLSKFALIYGFNQHF